uniref:Ovarian cyclin B n=1 Tax=Eriocheir sinensis TaxID=95602 RepID=B2MV15_ERISI|nr:ovarian cyclin B [Eriocheir sinensis]
MTDQSIGPRKVEAKVYQGPTLHRTALGEMSNSNLPRISLRGSKAMELLKKQTQQPQPPPAPAPDCGDPSQLKGLSRASSLSFKRYNGKENIQPKPVLEKVKEVNKKEEDVVEEMEVEELAVAFSTQRFNVEDIDSQDADNPQLVSEYVCDIYKYLRTLEDNSPVQQQYLEGQIITHKMRAILVDWLVQVHHRFTLMQETLYLTVGTLDRYLQVVRNTPRNMLQLVGVTAMFIACKFEEMYCTDVGDLSLITDKAYTKREILAMEVKMLKALKFNISFPLPLHFLRRNSKAGLVDSRHHTLAKYLMELCLPEYSMCHFKASILAAAALCLTLKLLDGGEWNDTLIYHSSYTEEQLMPVMCKIATIVVKSHHSKQQAVRQKYDSAKLMKISKIPQLKSDLISKLAERSASFS